MVKLTFLTIALFLSASAWSATQHKIITALDPEAHTIAVTDEITFMSPVCNKDLYFNLHSGLAPKIIGPINLKVELTGSNLVDPDYGLKTERFKVRLPCPLKTFTLAYQGEIYHPLENGDDSDSRGSADTPGIIFPDGIYLSAASFWYPQFENSGDPFISFDLKSSLPDGWTSVSQGERIEKDHWQDLSEQEDIYLIAAKFTEYQKTMPDGLQVYAFLRSQDDELAERYLSVTQGYIKRYSDLIGPFPYPKFALVENFWETGYGMPSFTLLGTNILRLPFIINSSYPHEILHDWWGNSVYVDSSRGNWCEGITAYLADHLMLELTGTADTWRRDSLQKYTDYVNPKNDFPLSKFLGRTDGPTEAIGYGKASMFFHMLRLKVGDDLFKKAWSQFYATNKFKRVSYKEIRDAFETVTELNLKADFDQWVERTGGPEIKVSDVTATPSPRGFVLHAKIEQVQLEPTFNISLPLAVHLAGKEMPYQTKVGMNSRSIEINWIFKDRPEWFQVDPEFDVFRRISSDEVPAVLTMALGSQKTVMVLPAQASDETLALWQQFIDGISPSLPQGSDIKVVKDSELSSIPDDAAIWVLGSNNSLVPHFNELLADQGVKIDQENIAINGEVMPLANRSVTLLGRDTNNKKQIWTFISTDGDSTYPLLASKLIHYGKYSYLGFEGEKVTNKLKGIWKLSSSSMSRAVEQKDGTVIQKRELKLAKRSALVNN